MNIQIVSDLHLEFEQNRQWLKDNPLEVTGDILLIAGDTAYLDVPDPHKRDEMPKNHVSKYVSTHGGSYAAWMEDATSYGGHKRQQGGHRMVSGIVRAQAKEEIRQQIIEQMDE